MTATSEAPLYKELAGKTAVVTGAGKGIGADCVKALIEQGCHVIGLSRTQSDLDGLHESYGEEKLTTYLLDVSKWQDVETVFSSLGPIHYLINNAGVVILDSLLNFTEEQYDAVMDTNLKGCFHVAQCAARNMVRHGTKGVIVNISSQASQRAFQDHTLYCCSKAGLDMLTKMLTLELGPKGIRSVSVNPTVVMTKLGAAAWSDPVKKGPMLLRIPLGRFAEVDDVTKTVLFCLSDSAAMVGGAHIPIDGGFWTA